jgi:hypothetical protein
MGFRDSLLEDKRIGLDGIGATRHRRNENY